MKAKFRLTFWWIKSALFLVPHSDLWTIGFIEMRRFARTRWWARAPFLPIPALEYWEFRMESIYGDPKAQPSARDLIEFLEWCLEIR